ncbi:histidine phosphatase family protein [Limibacter armeniacum]|uniref:histidine phosphatase family protein n=1 Tax=Limibacter armeniacum TaxID=466084 RepID=UPI002FE60919
MSVDSIGFTQSLDIKELKQYYRQQPKEACVELYEDSSKKVNQIVLVRHGQPDLSRKGWFNRKEAAAFVHAYDSVGIVPFKVNPICNEGLQHPMIFCSSIERAVNTSKLIFEEKYDIVTDARFREFERKVMHFWNIKMPLGVWLSVSRGLWILGLNDKGIETKRKAKLRSKGNADFLIAQTEASQQVILVAHGFHNRYVMKYLKKQGWKTVRKGGSHYGAVNILAQ